MKQVVALLLAAGVAYCQEAPPKISFDVASIHSSPLRDGASIRGIEVSGDRVHIGPIVPLNLIALAYGVQNTRVKGPEWLTSLKEISLFVIDAKMPAGSHKTMVPQMLQALLAERFSLSVEIGTTDVDALSLLVAKGGPKFQRGRSTEISTNYKGIPVIEITGVRFANGADGAQHIETSTPGGLALYLSNRYLPATFVDQTELEGEYDIKLDIPPVDPADAQLSPPQERGRETLPSALAKLGLKLESRKVAMKTIFVKHMEKNPTEN
ncbi:MAG: TIGR03435 family protein [Candidatus Solibacter sp.]